MNKKVLSLVLALVMVLGTFGLVPADWRSTGYNSSSKNSMASGQQSCGR